MRKNDEEPTGARHIGAVFEPDMIARLDAWRAAQPGRLNRSQALRLIVEERLPAAVKRTAKKAGG